jgi:hypothetical protein
VLALTIKGGMANDKIMIDGAFALHVKTKVPLSNGDEPGVAGGLVSSKFITRLIKCRNLDISPMGESRAHPPVLVSMR